jgi:perosamine synthetase
MTNLQAAVGLAQTERLGALVDARRANARRYAEALAPVPGLRLIEERPGVRSACWMVGVVVDEGAFGCTRDELRDRLAARGVETRTFFVPMHLQPAYFHAHVGERYPVAEELGRTGLYLPSSSGLTDDEIAYVAREVRRAADRG